MTLNVTGGLSKYLDVDLDQQLVANNVYVDSTALQILNDHPHWEQEDVLLRYSPVQCILRFVQNVSDSSFTGRHGASSLQSPLLRVLRSLHLQLVESI
jgi:hypothetical protein